VGTVGWAELSGMESTGSRGRLWPSGRNVNSLFSGRGTKDQVVVGLSDELRPALCWVDPPAARLVKAQGLAK
jgi:hypothetical protein